MSYQYPWSKKFKAGEFQLWSYPPERAPFYCQEHKPYCLIAANETANIVTTHGQWHLAYPLDIPTIMPGTKQKLISLSIKSMQKWEWAVRSSSIIRLILDGAKIFEEYITYGLGAWHEILWELNKGIEGAKKLDIWLEQWCAADFGWIQLHDNEIYLIAEYYATVPPQEARVEIFVKNLDTNTPIKNALVRLMSGARLVGSKYTDSGGKAVFEKVAVDPSTGKSSYDIEISASGYYDTKQSIEVVLPTVSYTVKLVPVPVTPLSSWVVPVVVGVIILGGGVTAYSVLKKPTPPTPPVVVMR